MGDRDGDLLVGDEVFKLDLGGLVDDLGAALVAVLVADVFEFLDDDLAQLLFAAEDLFVLGDFFPNLAEFVEDFVDRELGEAIELQFEDGIDLAQRKAALFALLALLRRARPDLTVAKPLSVGFALRLIVIAGLSVTGLGSTIR